MDPVTKTRRLYEILMILKDAVSIVWRMRSAMLPCCAKIVAIDTHIRSLATRDNQNVVPFSETRSLAANLDRGPAMS